MGLYAVKQSSIFFVRLRFWGYYYVFMVYYWLNGFIIMVGCKLFMGFHSHGQAMAMTMAIGHVHGHIHGHVSGHVRGNVQRPCLAMSRPLAMSHGSGAMSHEP